MMRIVWQTVRRITVEILGVNGLIPVIFILLSGRLYLAILVNLHQVPMVCLYCPLPVLNGHLKWNHSNQTKNDL